jgi:hypothetical protein
MSYNVRERKESEEREEAGEREESGGGEQSSKNIPLKRNQNPSRYYYNSIITNLKFQHTSQYIIFQNPSYNNFKNRPIIFYYYYLGAYKNPLKLLYSIMNLNTIISLPTKARSKIAGHYYYYYYYYYFARNLINNQQKEDYCTHM